MAINTKGWKKKKKYLYIGAEKYQLELEQDEYMKSVSVNCDI